MRVGNFPQFVGGIFLNPPRVLVWLETYWTWVFLLNSPQEMVSNAEIKSRIFYILYYCTLYSKLISIVLCRPENRTKIYVLKIFYVHPVKI